ncbi:hypothetical protein B7494_g2570 [Chlorociboria aeruginascens]|nr:hypothetical protein B7494_g2570 [Chlorociboria aeruginascens]
MFPTSSQAPGLTAQPNKITRGHSCVLCQQRKVKCDRLNPCSNCIKSRAECVASTPTAPRRRRKKLTETDLVARLRRYEELLKSNGVKVDEEEIQEADEAIEDQDANGAMQLISLHLPRAPTDQGKLYIDKGNTRFVDNGLWENLNDEINNPKDVFSEDDEETSLFPDPGSILVGHQLSKNLSAQHPPPVQIFQLWQIFLTNVNPLVKCFHAPTVQQMILDATGDLANVSRSNEALMFGIYLLAVTSIKNEECETKFRESKTSLLSKYARASQQALINAKFMKSLNLASLQAFSLYLLALRRIYDQHSFWILTGAAIRIGQRLGIHRDGSSHNMSPFDAEMRRRVWWHIVFLDGHASKLAGAGHPTWLTTFDTKLPLNISDSDLSPSMTEIPVERQGATEMMFCSLRYEVAEALRTSSAFSKKCDGQWVVATGSELIREKDKAIDAIESRFENKYLKFCDPSIPLHLLCIYVAKSVICTMRLIAHHPRQYSDKGASMPQEEKDMIFYESLKLLEYDSLGHSHKAVQGFLWHIHSHFQLDAFIYILSELRHRTSGDLAERAWEQVKQAYDFRPEMINNSKNGLYFAVGNLVLKAWVKREESQYRGTYQTPPEFISILHAQRKIDMPPKPTSQKDADNLVNDFAFNAPLAYGNQGPREQLGNVDFGFEATMMDVSPMDWEYWQTLMGGDLPSYDAYDASGEWL